MHLYSKLEHGSENDSAYLNDYYLFKRVSEELKQGDHASATIANVSRVIQGFVDRRALQMKEPLSEGTVQLYNRQLKAFISNIYGESVKARALIKGGESKL